MKYILRLPTNDQYAYIEQEGEYDTIDEALEAYNIAMTLIKGGTGLPDKEFNAFLDRMLKDEPNHIEDYEKASADQKAIIQILKRALKRADYKQLKAKA